MTPLPWLLRPLVAIWLCAGLGWSQTTVPVYLPGYDASDWKALRGSVIKSDESMTTYTIFCAQQTPPSCVLDDALPFLFAEGASSMSFGGAVPGDITADLRCDLVGTTAATCTGYSSLGADFHEGPFTGPTETTWTSTFSGSAVEWGVLTLTTAPTTTLTPNLDGTDIESEPKATSNPTSLADPSSPTSAASLTGKGPGNKLSLSVAFISGGAILAGILLP